MSIKQYHWILVENADLFELMDKIKQVIEPIFFEKMSENIMIAADAVLNAGGKEITWNDTPLMAIEPNRCFQYSKEKLPAKDRLHWLVGEVISFSNHLNKINSVTFSKADIGYEVSVLPGPSKGDVIFRVFSEMNDYNEALSNQNLGADFSYWNNVDKDDNISDEDWSVRENYWKNFPDKSIASMGLSFSNPTVIETNIALKHVYQKIQDMVKNRSSK